MVVLEMLFTFSGENGAAYKQLAIYSSSGNGTDRPGVIYY